MALLMFDQQKAYTYTSRQKLKLKGVGS